ncbi:ATP-binding cassette domain-containing protein [Lactobacillus sp. XV13L]|nr:ATP-binding cassette domain-containing protein [Lactobacillus sp. XV13L]
MLEIKHLNYQPPQKSHFLWQDISVRLQTNKIYGLVGVNGVGKSTLLNLLSGLTLPSAGDIYWQQQPIHQSKTALRQYLTQVGYCLQDADHLFFKQTVREELEYHPQADLQSIIELLQLQPLLERSPFELSGGQKKRLGLAIMLLRKPQILLGDEITAGLDAHFQKVVLSLLQSYRDQHLVVLVTHNLEEALQMCDELLFLDKQGLHNYPTAQVVQQPELFAQFGLLKPTSLHICQQLIAAGLLPAATYYRSNKEIAQALAAQWDKDAHTL